MMQVPDPIEQQVFWRLSREEQLKALHGMIQYLRSEQANDKRIIIGLQAQVTALSSDIEYLRGEMAGVGMRQKAEDTVSTSQKIKMAFDDRFAFIRPIAQHVLGVLADIILLAILYMAFGGRVP